MEIHKLSIICMSTQASHNLFLKLVTIVWLESFLSVREWTAQCTKGFAQQSFHSLGYDSTFTDANTD